MGLSAISCSVRAVFFVTFGSLAALGAPFASQIVLGFGMRFDLRKSMSEIDVNGEIHQKAEKRHAKIQNAWHAKKAHFHHRRVRYKGGLTTTSLPWSWRRSRVAACLTHVSLLLLSSKKAPSIGSVGRPLALLLQQPPSLLLFLFL